MTRARLIESRSGRPHEALALMDCIASFYNSKLRRDIPKAADLTPDQHIKLLQNRLHFSFTDTNHPVRVEAAEMHANLRDLACLWDEHKAQLTLHTYEATSPQDIAMSMLNRVAAFELLPSTIEMHIKPYIARHENLSLKTFLLDYCLAVMNESAIWEPRVLAIIPLIQDVNLECQVVIEIMRRASIPWSSELDACIQKYRKDTSCNDHKDVEEQYRLMQLRVMMMKYGILSFNFANMGLARRLLWHILKQVDKPDAIRDALQVGISDHRDRFRHSIIDMVTNKHCK
eukprot:jgi/Hompol1/5213/HPOL_001920-RA